MENSSLTNLSNFQKRADQRRQEEADRQEVEQLIKNGKTVLSVHWSEVYPNPQVRKTFKNIPELAYTIATMGQESPIRVRPKDDKGYCIRRGERRWRACKYNDSNIDIIIDDKELDDVGHEKAMQLIENVQREDLTPMETAEGLAELLLEYGRTQGGLAKEIGMSESKVSKYLALLKAPECVQELLEAEYTSDLELVGILRKVHELDPKRCEQMCATVMDEGMSRGMATGILRAIKQEKSDKDRADANPKTGSPKLDDPGSLAEAEHERELNEAGLNESGLELPPEPDPEPVKTPATARSPQDPHAKQETALLNKDGFYERRPEDAILLCEIEHNGTKRKGVLQLHLLADEDDEVVLRISGENGEDELVACKADSVKLIGYKQ
ncbi:ParB/RepB/Spo0J family partition protein [Marinobacter sp. F3R08]|uniref:ParB/RepB/Spo0J family partition protein n=1 Tax=Marinobacter sp. F3R08 TaxID=2841559 RepID=UPI001C09FD21|nr:ParB/RepB/Spo0J family partition protein [Marinobacter sp. F3R08]MBU2952225.1 ParB/RepB/Spo0J family partition protein [Marinobacter sp. F3R08]